VQTLVALLRGVNVGGKVKVPMAELREELADLGLKDVVTYIQSGNVVFRTGEKDVGAAIEKRIEAKYGLNVSVILRTLPELRRIAKRNPFPRADKSRLHVVFLAGKPKARAELEPERSPGDEFAVKGREVYLHLPNGAGRTKLTLDYLERRLGVAGTQRNWNTLLKLVELAGSLSPR
jgi:uncharacterized protein (DUF1697 family)